ncbi:hypothetical protein AVEN_41316-1 [Araneus ventricosus]|uniref:Uncharacterized protein n=1 Tax=Araneus ventricosus TaxID=182803 RepID=A0A4Y2SEB6_ARAVE|nr:hypothetical protein AVEN_41316-1 [Araneus ventricosus]
MFRKFHIGRVVNAPLKTPLLCTTSCHTGVHHGPHMGVMTIEDSLLCEGRLICEEHKGRKTGICSALLQTPLCKSYPKCIINISNCMSFSRIVFQTLQLEIPKSCAMARVLEPPVADLAQSP